MARRSKSVRRKSVKRTTRKSIARKSKKSPKTKSKKSPKTKSPKKTLAKTKKSVERGCVYQSGKKYLTRESPPYPANECCNMNIIGNDGNMWKSVRSSNGVCRWVKA